MRFAIDASNLRGKNTGLDFMTEGIIEGFKNFPEHEVLVYTTEAFPGVGDLTKENNGENNGVVVIPRPQGAAGGLRWYWKATRDMRRRDVHVFVSTWTFTAAALFPKTIQIIPDLSPIFFPEMFEPKHVKMFKLTLQIALRRAWKCVAISQSVAAEVKKMFPWYTKKIQSIPLSINNWAINPQSTEEKKLEIRHKYSLADKYFLSVSTIQPRKNYVNMIRGFAEFLKTNPDFQYVIVGKKGWKYEEVFAEVKNLALDSQVKFLDYAPDADLSALTDAAAGFLYASTYEGFGIPPLNAAYRGIPVLTSDIPVFREILTDKEAIFADPKSARDIAQGMQDLLGMKLVFGNENLVSKFSWKNCAAKLIELAVS